MKFIAVAALLVLGAVNAAPVAPAAAKPDVKAAAPKVEKAAAPVAAKPVVAAKTAPVAKKVASPDEMQAEIAGLSHLSTETGEMEGGIAAESKKMEAVDKDMNVEKLRKSVFASKSFQEKVEKTCAHKGEKCATETSEALFCKLLKRSKPEAAAEACKGAASFVQIRSHLRAHKAPEDELAKEMTHDLEMNFNKIAPFGKEDTAKELQDHAAKTQDTLVDAVENAEVAEIKRAVFRALTRLRAATIKEFDTIARLETQAIDAYNDAHHYRAENPLAHLHEDEAPVETDKLKSFH